MPFVHVPAVMSAVTPIILIPVLIIPFRSSASRKKEFMGQLPCVLLTVLVNYS